MVLRFMIIMILAEKKKKPVVGIFADYGNKLGFQYKISPGPTNRSLNSVFIIGPIALV